MIAVIQTGGKQYKVSAGQKLKIEKLALNEGDTIKFDTLLKSSLDGADLQIGEPFLDEKLVEAKVLKNGLADKIQVIKYKNKTRYKRNKGHRQPFTEIEIVKIG